jgi:hypothetical protein
MKLKVKQIYDRLLKIQELSCIARNHCLSVDKKDLNVSLRKITDHANEALSKLESIDGKL